MTKMNLDFKKTTGKIKAMHGVGQPPFVGMDYSYIRYLKEANIPYSRLHDVGGWFGGNMYVDIPNIFRDFDADENNPDSYDFAFTDVLITALIENGVKPIYRLGVTIENFAKIKAYRIFPPKDFAKWARICEHIIRHYNEGWANGFHYGIEYWEIWNEPEIHIKEKNEMWQGTPLEYFELYTITTKHLKECFGDSIKVGGYASCGCHQVLVQKGIIPSPVDDPSMIQALEEKDKFLYDFLEYIKEHNAPLDFFSWHSYMPIDQTLIMSEYFNNALEKYGYGDVEIQINEWNNADERIHRGSSFASAQAAGMMCAMQNTNADILCYYDARIGVAQHGGLFNPDTLERVSTYYVFKAFGELYELGEQAVCSFEEKGLYAVAATDGSKNAVLISNTTEKDLDIQIENLNNYDVYLIDKENHLIKTELNSASFKLNSYQVVLIKNYL